MKEMAKTSGIHHVTAIAGDPQTNLDFYAGTLGMRLVKISVNQDDPTTYHFFYADGVGTPGSDLTFFPYPGGRGAEAGRGTVSEIDLSVPTGALEFWSERLARQGTIASKSVNEFGDESLSFQDPDRLALRITEAGTAAGVAWEGMPVDARFAVMRIRGVRIVPGHPTLASEAKADTETVLASLLGFRKVAEARGVTRYESVPGKGIVELANTEGAPEGRGGHGGVHHVAFSVPTEEAQIELHDRILEAGLRASPIIDRFYFKSVYFREPGGVLFEIATEGPGFTADEPLESLGTKVALPPFLQAQRETIERHLPSIVLPGPRAAFR